jgi:hypothetical protein
MPRTVRRLGLRLEPVLLYLTDRPVTHLLIDVIGRGIQGICVQAADRMTTVQHELAGGRYSGACVPATTTLRWRIDRADSCHKSGRASRTYKTDWHLVLPDEKASMTEVASDFYLELLNGLLGRHVQLLVEMGGPSNKQHQI